jgi:hypothetical protein
MSRSFIHGANVSRVYDYIGYERKCAREEMGRDEIRTQERCGSWVVTIQDWNNGHVSECCNHLREPTNYNSTDPED